MVLDFNSIKVQLKPSRKRQDLHVVGNFNSIKVQLKQAYRCPAGVWTIFQFHKGTIKTVT